MKDHKYRIGQIVTFVGTGYFSVAAGQYEVTRLLPESGRDFQYRIRNLAKGEERVVREQELKSVAVAA